MTILITGAASGIGRALAEKMLSEGHIVYALDIVACEAKERLIPLRADITKEEDLRLVHEKLCADAVTLDSLICVAGIHRMASLVESEPDTLSRVIDVNLIGTMLTCRILHSLIAPKGRVFIVTSEVASFDPLPFNGLYNVSKTALDAYAQKVITIRPGAVETPLQNSSLSGTEQLAATTKLYKKQSKHFLYFVKHFMGKPMRAVKLGYSHPIELEDPEGITTETPDANTILIKGIDKAQVGNYAANVRGWRPPEPYKGKGVLYDGEVVHKKEGKSGVAG